MPRCRLLAASVVVAAVLLGLGAPVAARPDHASRQDPIASDDPAPVTEPSVPTGIDVGHQGDQSGAVAPDDDVVVEPADPDNVNEVLRISSDEAQARRDEVQADLDDLDARIDRMTSDIAAFDHLSDDLVVKQRIVARRAVAARRMMMERAVGAYVSGNTPDVAIYAGGGDPNEVQERSAIVRTILEADQHEADRLLARRLDITARLSRVLEQAEQTQAELRGARADREVLEVRLDSADFTLQVLEAGGDIVITGFVFPVADPHTFSSTFGAPRSGGRSHEGNDIFAPMGTPLLASERGVVANVGVGTLGGTKLWVYGESGTRYYYAHLIAYADGIVEGTPVEAGQVIGYVGNTGNAITTPPHLHFEIHPDGGDAIDPYPLLHAVDVIDGEHVLPNLYDQDIRP
jgi:murein DD-endopeptidase MepM/ murein hydrolase activator NlpD